MFQQTLSNTNKKQRKEKTPPPPKEETCKIMLNIAGDKEGATINIQIKAYMNKENPYTNSLKSVTCTTDSIKNLLGNLPNPV